MNDVELKVYVAATNFGGDVDIAFALRGPSIIQVAKVLDGGSLQWSPVEPHRRLTPTLSIDRDMATELLAGLMKLNLPLPSAGAIEGELKATKIHLDDLRHLLKIIQRQP